jgi:hypothetical protein
MILTFAVLPAGVGSQMFPGQAGQQDIFCVLSCAQLTLPRGPAQHYCTITHTVPVPDRKNLLVSCRTCMSLLIPPRDGHLDKVAKRIHVKIISLPGVPRPPGSKFFAESDPSLDPDPDPRFREQNL